MICRHSSADERALWVLLAETGFRVNDLLKIRQWQVPKCAPGLPMATDRCGLTEPHRLKLREAKTGKQREVELSERAIAAMRWALNNCPDRHPLKYLYPAKLRSGAVDRYSDRPGKRHTHRSTVYRHFANCVKAAGLAGRGYTVHSLRKIYARKLYEKTGSVLKAQSDLGHSSIATTLLYVTDLQL